MIRSPQESLAAALDRLSADLTALARDEVALAKQEMEEKAREAAVGVAIAAAAAMLAATGAILLMVTVILGLSTAMPAWLACALVGVATLTAAMVMGAVGIGVLRRVSPVPERTIASVRSDVEWLGRRLRESS
ncbi:MAG TPA: phage holin family protein [Gaiellales bacterium]|jgi:uncharacterized membrane protein YqjE|nr:phage holin family protein [Gaiellales bacterium]